MNEAPRQDPDPTVHYGVSQRRTKQLTTVFFMVVFLVISYFLGRSIISQWALIRDHSWQIDYRWLAGSMLVLWIVSFHIINLWRYILFTVSGKWLKFGGAFRITILSNLGKYLPGKVWAVMGMFYLLNREGYSTASALACSVLHQTFTLIAGAIFIFIILGQEIFHGMSVAFLGLGALLSIIILYPPIFSGILNWGLRMLKREPLVVRLTFAKSIFLLLLYILSWTMYGTSFWCLLHALGIQPESFWLSVATFDAAYLLGFLAIFAPGGLGVREGVLTVLLSATITPGLAALIAVASRLWMTLFEVSQLLPLAITKIIGVKSGSRKTS
ncbi:lysylphosphatidylglycerol synthase transmembrane domain-containing protein [Candidatus Zixiibacteriota bacterium]